MQCDLVLLLCILSELYSRVELFYSHMSDFHSYFPSTFYTILKLQFTQHLVSLWMQRFTQFFGGSQLDFFCSVLFWAPWF